MDALRELYQDVILDHGRSPRNQRLLEHADHSAAGRNPLCGDTVVVYTRDADGRIEDVSFQGQGCAISMASASLMTEVLRGKTVEEARRLVDGFHHLCTDGIEIEGGLDEDDALRLAALSGVRQYPVRVKCATLPWHTLAAALDGRAEASTEEDA